jgi:hypothetical protein
METRIVPPAGSLWERLLLAASRQERARRRYHTLRRSAFAGHYDPDDLDRAILDWRAAAAEVRAVRRLAAVVG